MIHIFLDLEMNTIEKEKRAPDQTLAHEIVEIGAVKLDSNFDIIDEYSTYVKPSFNGITESCTFVTGITEQTVKDAPHFNIAIIDFIDWIGFGPVKIYSWSLTDKRQLLGECALKNVFDDDIYNPFTKWIDFQKIYSRLLGLTQVLSLQNAMAITQIPFEGDMHSALADAKNSALLLQIVTDKVALEKQMNIIEEAFKKENSDTPVDDIFSDKLRDFINP